MAPVDILSSSIHPVVFNWFLLIALQSRLEALRNGIDRGPISCERGKRERVIWVQKGDSGEIVSQAYPDSYSLDLYSSWCQIEIKSCSTCKIELKFVDVRFPRCEEREDEGKNKSNKICIPGCDHLHIHEVDSPYSDISHKNYHNGGPHYLSISSNLRVYHCMSNNTLAGQKKFKIQFQILEKYELKEGHVDENLGASIGSVRSPNYPNGYAMNGETFSYLLQNLDPYGHVRVIFDDWDIAPGSEVKVYDGLNIDSPSIILNLHHRPVLLSESNTIFIVFNTGITPTTTPTTGTTTSCCQHSGFKASYQFVSEKGWTEQPVTDCSNIYSMRGGGTISFTGLAAAFHTYFDCVWIIKRDRNSNQPAGLILRMGEVLFGDGWIQYSKSNKLEIREGVTSEGPLLYTYTYKNLTEAKLINTTGAGLYIRLHGGFYSTDKLNFIYTTYQSLTPEGCPVFYDFLCSNLLCIDQELMCDGTDHCGDGTDESPILDCSVSALWRLSFKWSVPTQNDVTTIKTGVVKTERPCYRGFMCVSGRECIARDQACDGIRDCMDGSDEHRCYIYGTNSSESFYQLKVICLIITVYISITFM